MRRLRRWKQNDVKGKINADNNNFWYSVNKRLRLRKNPKVPQTLREKKFFGTQNLGCSSLIAMIFNIPKCIDQPTNKLSYFASKGLNFQPQLFVASTGRSFWAYVSLSFRGRNFRVLPPKTSKKNNQNFFDSLANSYLFNRSFQPISWPFD